MKQLSMNMKRELLVFSQCEICLENENLLFGRTGYSSKHDSLSLRNRDILYHYGTNRL